MAKRIYARYERDKECIRHRFVHPRKGQTGPRRCCDCGTAEPQPISPDLDRAVTNARVEGVIW